MAMFNKITNLFKKGSLTPKNSQDEQSLATGSESDFLEDFFRLRRDGYRTVCVFHCEEAFKIEIKDSSDITAFTFKVSTRKEPGKLGLLYIEDFQRLKGPPCGIGREMAIALRKYAKKRGFCKILVNPVAAPGPDYLSQAQLEEFYCKYLEGDNVHVKFVPNDDSFYSEDLSKLTT